MNTYFKISFCITLIIMITNSTFAEECTEKSGGFICKSISTSRIYDTIDKCVRKTTCTRSTDSVNEDTIDGNGKTFAANLLANDVKTPFEDGQAYLKVKFYLDDKDFKEHGKKSILSTFVRILGSKATGISLTVQVTFDRNGKKIILPEKVMAQYSFTNQDWVPTSEGSYNVEYETPSINLIAGTQVLITYRIRRAETFNSEISKLYSNAESVAGALGGFIVSEATLGAVEPIISLTNNFAKGLLGVDDQRTFTKPINFFTKSNRYNDYTYTFYTEGGSNGKKLFGIKTEFLFSPSVNLANGEEATLANYSGSIEPTDTWLNSNILTRIQVQPFGEPSYLNDFLFTEKQLQEGLADLRAKSSTTLELQNFCQKLWSVFEGKYQLTEVDTAKAVNDTFKFGNPHNQKLFEDNPDICFSNPKKKELAIKYKLINDEPESYVNKSMRFFVKASKDGVLTDDELEVFRSYFNDYVNYNGSPLETNAFIDNLKHVEANRSGKWSTRIDPISKMVSTQFHYTLRKNFCDSGSLITKINDSEIKGWEIKFSNFKIYEVNDLATITRLFPEEKTALTTRCDIATPFTKNTCRADIQSLFQCE